MLVAVSIVTACALGVAFYVRFLFALCQELRRERICYVMQSRNRIAHYVRANNRDMTRRSLLFASLLIASMWGGGTLASTSFAQKASVPKRPTPVAMVSAKVKEILALMDTDKNGKISKQEWMKFMTAEFDRLDTKKTGEIDPEAAAVSQVRRARSYE